MRKHVVFLMTGLVLCAASIGFFRTNTYQKVEAASDSKLSYDKDDKITLGHFPLKFNSEKSDEAWNGRLDAYLDGRDLSSELADIVTTTVDEKKYGMVIYTNTDEAEKNYRGSDPLPFNPSLMIDSGKARTGIFDFVDLKWVKYAESGDYIEFISDYIVYRDMYHANSGTKVNYDSSALCDNLNGTFLNMAFTDAEKSYLTEKEINGKRNVYIDLPKLEIVESSIEPSCSGPSDIAILTKISAKESYKNAPYWTQDATEETRMAVRWYGKTVTNCLYSDDKIGVRPVIKIKADMIKPYNGGGSSSKTTTPSNVNPAIPIGIIFGVLGVGSLVAFFILWNKRLKEDPTYKAPGWYYAIIFVATAFCCVSTITFSTQSISGEGGGGLGGGLGGCTFKCGYYLQSTAKYEDANANFVQVGLACYLFRSDGTVSYCAAVEKEDASDFRADSGSGSWTQSGCTLKFTYTTPIGSVAPTFTISGTKLLYKGSEAYHWVRGE